MKAINPRTNNAEDYEELSFKNGDFIRFDDGFIMKKQDAKFVDEFNGFVNVTDEDLPGDTIESIIFRMIVAIASSIFTVAVLYYAVKGAIWLVQKML